MERKNKDMNLTTESAEDLARLLNQLEYEEWETITNGLVMPLVNALGVFTCSFSYFVFFKRKFSNHIFFYYRLLSLLSILCNLINILFGVCFSPRFFPSINTFSCGMYLHAYSLLNPVLFNYCSLLEACILLTRMKIFSPFVKKHFNLSPQLVSVIIFILCFLFNAAVVILFKINYVGDFYYLNSDGKKQNNLFYNLGYSELASSSLGKAILAFSFSFNIPFIMFLSIALNVISFSKFESYSMRRIEGDGILLGQMQSSTSRSATNNRHEILEQTERSRRKIEKNMFYMAFTLSSISVVSRITVAICVAYFWLNYSFANLLKLSTLCNIVYTLVPMSLIFVFYTFNQLFREELNKVFRLKNLRKGMLEKELYS